MIRSWTMAEADYGFDPTDCSEVREYLAPARLPRRRIRSAAEYVAVVQRLCHAAPVRAAAIARRQRHERLAAEAAMWTVREAATCYDNEAYAADAITAAAARWEAEVEAARARARAAEAAADSRKRRQELRAESTRRRRRASDGALVGVRWWIFDGACLMSPYQCTVWPTRELIAPHFGGGSRCRMRPGIHAFWRRREAVQEAVNAGNIVGRVLGYGRYIAGHEGWRAERVVIDRLWIGRRVSAQAETLQARYGVPVTRLGGCNAYLDR